MEFRYDLHVSYWDFFGVFWVIAIMTIFCLVRYEIVRRINIIRPLVA
jgi:hypothetical protein